MSTTEKILILDFGSQVTQLIARRLRELSVYCEIHPYTMDESKIQSYGPNGIILSGGPCSVNDEGSPRASDIVFDLDVPVLGICYGQQTMIKQLGGTIKSGEHGEFGRAFVDVKKDSPLLKGFEAGHTEVWMSHGDHVSELADGFEIVGVSDNAPLAVIANEKRKLYGVQFHPEVAHTPRGIEIFKNFCYDICGLSGNWTMSDYKDEAIQTIRDQVGDKQVICGLSGGVDSAVTAVLIHEAIGDQLTCIFVDTGLLRLNEATEVETLFRDHYKIKLRVVDASDRFLGALEGVADPEIKRKIIGAMFIDIFEEEASAIGGADFLAQGTLYPDVIESVSLGGPSQTIKSHHNVGGLPERMRMELVEPLRLLFYDDVRNLGRALGMPNVFIGRHPFPGPGLAVRMPGAVSKTGADILRLADAIYIDELHKNGLYDKIWQAFAVLLPVRTVGVMGDSRTYDQVCALRAVTSEDGMTADSYPFEHAFLSKVSTRIINEVKGINRVVYDITSKPPGTIEWE